MHISFLISQDCVFLPKRGPRVQKRSRQRIAAAYESGVLAVVGGSEARLDSPGGKLGYLCFKKYNKTEVESVEEEIKPVEFDGKTNATFPLFLPFP